MDEKWYVTHVFRGENYLAKGPHGDKGEPTSCFQMMWEGQANDVRDILNNLEKEVKSLKMTMLIHAGDICSANNEADRFIDMNKELEDENRELREALEKLQVLKQCSECLYNYPQEGATCPGHADGNVPCSGFKQTLKGESNG